MTISSITRKAGPFAGNGVTVDFPFTFKVFSTADLYVVKSDSVGAETELILTADFTVSLNADQNDNPGGTLTLPAALATGYNLTITSDIAALQPVDLTNAGGFYPTVINTAFDRLTMLIQQLAESVSRSLKFSISTPSGTNPQLPTPVPYALIAWNAAGDGFQNSAPSGSASAIAADLVLSSGASMVGFSHAETYAAGTLGAKGKRVISVTDAPFNAVGDGVTNDRAAIAAAVAYINTVGGELYFPPGHYYTPYLSHTDIANWIEITKSGVSFTATPGSVILENFLFYAHGTYGAPQIVGAAGFSTGARQINTAAAHGLVAGDYVQLLSGINAYTPDAGVWQLGSENPTLLTTPNCRHAEIHRVSSVDSATTATLYDNVIYSDYRDNVVGQSFPMSGIIGAEIRKVTPVVGLLFRGIAFKNVAASSFREILIRAAVNVRFESCHFEAKGLPGVHVKTTDVLNLTFSKCTSYRKPENASGSSWNSFVFGGCSQGVFVDRCHLIGERQTIDISPGMLASDIGYTGDALRCDYLTSQLFTFTSNTFTDCGDGFTTHPGTYNLTATGNTFEGCSNGIRARSRKNTITGNTFRTYAAGIELSAFYEDSLISGNNLEQRPDVEPRAWLGINVTPMSSEAMNNNDFKNIVISNNLFKVVQAHASNAGIQFRHGGNGVPANAGFTRFTDTIKTNLSNYQITQNRFVGCSARVNRWINGVAFSGNVFGEGSDATHYIVCDTNSARHTINQNLFSDGTVPAFTVGVVTSPSYSYDTTHRIGYQFGGPAATVAVTDNAAGLNMTGFGLPVLDGVAVVSGGSIKARRGSGVATLRLDAEASDGTSDVVIRAFDLNTSTGSKTFLVTGRVSTENSYPRTDNVYSSGLSANRWSVVYAGTGAINTSDAREKQQARELSAAEYAVAVRLKGLIRAFKFNDAVAAKGEAARIHIGVIAQDVAAAFAAEGLDGSQYGIVCFDEWADEFDEDGNLVTPAGNRYGVRYDELLTFMLAAL